MSNAYTTYLRAELRAHYPGSVVYVQYFRPRDVAVWCLPVTPCLLYPNDFGINLPVSCDAPVVEPIVGAARQEALVAVDGRLFGIVDQHLLALRDAHGATQQAAILVAHRGLPKVLPSMPAVNGANGAVAMPMAQVSATFSVAVLKREHVTCCSVRTAA